MVRHRSQSFRACAFASGGRRGRMDRHVADQPRRRCALICGLNFGTYSASVPGDLQVGGCGDEASRRASSAQSGRAARGNTLHRLPAAARSDCLRRAMGSRKLPRASGVRGGAPPLPLGPEALPAGGTSPAGRLDDRVTVRVPARSETLRVGLCRGQLAGSSRHGTVSRNARSDRPDREREEARKKAVAKDAVFAGANNEREERDEEGQRAE
jgi:hypothetical protein